MTGHECWVWWWEPIRASMADKTLSTPRSSNGPFITGLRLGWGLRTGGQLGLYPTYTHTQNSTCLVLPKGWDSQCCPQLAWRHRRESILGSSCEFWQWGFERFGKGSSFVKIIRIAMCRYEAQKQKAHIDWKIYAVFLWGLDFVSVALEI